MTERKNVKFTVEAYELLKEHKHKHETWNHFVHRVFGDQEDEKMVDST